METLVNDFDGVVIKIISVERNKMYSCNECYSEKWDPCEVKAKLMDNPEKGKVVLTEIKLQLTNTNEVPYDFYHSNFIMVDSDGFQYKHDVYSCNLQEEKGFSTNLNLHLRPKGKVKTILFFPMLTEGIFPERLDYTQNVYLDPANGIGIDGYININLKDMSAIGNASKEIIVKKRESYKLERANWGNYLKALNKRQDGSYLYGSEEAGDQIAQLEYLIFKRFNNILPYYEAVDLDNKIKNLGFKIKQAIMRNKELAEHNKVLDMAMEEYNSNLKKEQQKKPEIEDIKAFDNLDPREFEIFVQFIFKSKGYTTKLTPYVRDEGIDVVLEKNGAIFGVQCKYYGKNNNVGSESIQNFIGALKNIKASGGFFVTTGQFTKYAIDMAKKNNIKLITLPLLPSPDLLDT